jgi:hypothetical protein
MREREEDAGFNRNPERRKQGLCNPVYIAGERAFFENQVVHAYADMIHVPKSDSTERLLSKVILSSHHEVFDYAGPLSYFKKLFK